MNSSSNQFGLMVAYLLPGFIGLAGIMPFAPVVSTWLQPLNQAQASLGAPVYAVLAATTIGMIASCFRWLLLDHLHHWTGVKPPAWDDDRLSDRVVAFDYLVDNHYRYYQFFANTLVAVLFSYSVNRLMRTSSLLGLGSDFFIVILCATLFMGSRDSLSKYYARTSQLMGTLTRKGGAAMTNGNQHEFGGGTSNTPRAKPNTQSKPESRAKPKEDTPRKAQPSK